MNESELEDDEGGCGGCALIAFIATIVLVTLAAPVVVVYFTEIHDQQMMHSTDQRNFDPVDGFEEASKLVDDSAQFKEMTVRFVRSDGTLDLAAEYQPTVSYVWHRAATDTRPVGVGNRTAVEEIEVLASDFGFEHTGQIANRDFYRFDLGFRKYVSKGTIRIPTVAPPTCSMAVLWKHVLKKGATGEEVAIVEYNADGYTFSIAETDIEARFGLDCKPI